jgi:hypothetical protein
MKFKKPVVAFDMTDDYAHIAVGMADGTFSVRKNKSKQVVTRKVDPMANYRFDLGLKKQVLSYKYFNRGIYSKDDGSADTTVSFINSKKMKKYDTYLKKFRYGEALKHALTTNDTQIIISMIEELAYRNGLNTAIKNLEEKDVKLLLKFVYKKCDSANHQNLVFFIFEQCLAYLG